MRAGNSRDQPEVSERGRQQFLSMAGLSASADHFSGLAIRPYLLGVAKCLSLQRAAGTRKNQFSFPSRNLISVIANHGWLFNFCFYAKSFFGEGTLLHKT